MRSYGGCAGAGLGMPSSRCHASVLLSDLRSCICLAASLRPLADVKPVPAALCSDEGHAYTTHTGHPITCLEFWSKLICKGVN